MNSLGIANKVKLHLIYTVMWSNMITLTLDQVSTVTASDIGIKNDNRQSSQNTYILKGTNPKNGVEEYVLPISKRSKVTLENLDMMFESIEKIDNCKDLDKVLMAIVDTDGSIFFYYVSRGVKNFTD